MKRLKRQNSLLIFAAICTVIGIGLLIYPSLAQYLYQAHASQAVADLSKVYDSMEPSEKQAKIDEAVAYNQTIIGSAAPFTLSDEETEKIHQMLTVDDSGIISYIEIPKIDLELPIYHGLSDEVLQAGVGHMDGSSLPVGGDSTHCILAGHRGSPTAELFTRLDELEIGDKIILNTLGEELTYEVDQIRTVDPENVTGLSIHQGQDLVTLVTCTPYGINSERLLVQGHRVANEEVAETIESGESLYNSLLFKVSIGVGILIAFALLVYTVWKTRKKQNK